MLIRMPEILFPNDKIDLEKWSVIACDQFTSQKDYWEKLNAFCGDISTLRIIYPEIYIGQNQQEKIKNINSTMVKYYRSGIFVKEKGFVLTVRKTAYGRKRLGLVISIDLDEYDFNDFLEVRATEATVPERLPVRVEIRENAVLELPHAILLIDDKKKSVLEPLYEKRDTLKKLYGGKLNSDGGEIEGYLVDDENVVKLIEKTKTDNGNSFTFAVGDGNHSIATAKLCWEKIKRNLSERERENHPARYCLCEVENLYDDGIVFEPIHRVVKNVGENFIEFMRGELFGEKETELYYRGNFYKIHCSSSSPQAISDIQKAIDKFVKKSGVIQDYVHGKNNTIEVASDNSVAVFMPKLKKEDLFSYISQRKILTRKSFSMGEAEEKRYYLECKLIKNPEDF